jgi:transposase-like protein
MQSVLSAAHYHSEEVAYAYVEARLWPDGPICPHCGATEDHVGKLNGKTTRVGLYKCYACRKPFNVKIGTVLEKSHVPLRHWLQTIYLMSASKKGISTRQIQRTFQCSLKTAWFLTMRVREAMAELHIGVGPLGGANQVVEADETSVGGKAASRKGYIPPKAPVLALVERDGRVRNFHVPNVTAQTLKPIIVSYVNKATYLMTDESPVYWSIGREFSGPRCRQPLRAGICPCPLLAHQHRRKFLLDLQARHLRLLFSRQRGASAPLRRRVRLPV